VVRLPLPRREVIGPPDCPIILRWTLLGEPTWPGRWPFKVMVHRFPPNADDRDAHDHPRPFVTLVLRGGYDDDVPCPTCRGTARRDATSDPLVEVPCECGDGLVPGDRVRAPALRRRRAEYAHRTRVLPSGAWTVVVMGPVRRPWGFWRAGGWWPFRDYEREFGFAMRCDDLDQEYRNR
jgi:hypothetical protein